MNTITANPTAAIFVANHIINERVQQAQERARARAIREEQRSARRNRRLSAKPQTQYVLPWWAFRFVHPAH